MTVEAERSFSSSDDHHHEASCRRSLILQSSISNGDYTGRLQVYLPLPELSGVMLMVVDGKVGGEEWVELSRNVSKRVTLIEEELLLLLSVLLLPEPASLYILFF